MPSPSPRRNRARSAALTVLLGVAAGAPLAPAAQASLVAVSEAPAGDSKDPATPGRDLTAAGLAYSSSTGTVTGAIRLAGAPSREAQAQVGIFAGTRGPAGCTVYPAVGFSFLTATSEPRWARVDGPAAVISGRAEHKGAGQAIQTLIAQDDRLKALRPDCAIITVNDPADPAGIYDAIGPLDLVGQPDLTARFTGVPSPFATGRSRQVSVVVRNTGDAPSGKLRLRLRPARGVSAKPGVVSVPSLAAGAKRTIKVRITPTSRAASRSTLTAIVGKAPIEARAEAEIRHRRTPKPSPGGGGGGGGGGGSQVCTRWIPDFSGETGGYLGLVPC